MLKSLILVLGCLMGVAVRGAVTGRVAEYYFVDNEVEKNAAWPVGILVHCNATDKNYVQTSGGFVEIPANWGNLTGKPATFAPITTGLELTANKGAAGGYAGLVSGTVPIAQLPTGSLSTTVCVGNDARLSDSRAPNGAATGDLTGNYPGPTIAPLAVSDAKVATANKDGAVGVYSMRTLGTGAAQSCAGNDARLLAGLDEGSRVFRSRTLVCGSTFLTISGTAYFVYLGRTTASITPAFCEVHVTTIGAGAQVAELGLFSTPAAPNRAGQTVTKLAATGTIGALTATGVIRNTSTLGTAVVAGTHLWVGFRTAMATTQPTCVGVANDLSDGALLTTAAAAAFTTAGPWTGVVPTIATATIAPEIRATLD